MMAVIHFMAFFLGGEASESARCMPRAVVTATPGFSGVCGQATGEFAR
jgi:hypothetical protein